MTTKQVAEFSPSDRFISLNVFKFPLGNCGGITDHVKDIYIPHKDGYIKYADIENKELIFIPEQRGPQYFAVKPLLQPIGVIGPMAGGNLAYSSDSRCPVVYHIHDRFETQEAYNHLSN